MKIIFYCLVAAMCSTAALADDSFLPAYYDRAAFVRFSNTDLALEDTPMLNDVALQSLQPRQTTRYLPVLGKTTVGFAGGRSKYKFERGQFYTVVPFNGNHQVIKDKKVINSAKAVFSVYNLTNTPINVRTADGKVVILKDVLPGTEAGREINAVQTRLGIFNGNKKIKELESVSFRRDETTSLLVAADSEASMSHLFVQSSMKANH